jgi:hypothetical protein
MANYPPQDTSGVGSTVEQIEIAADAVISSKILDGTITLADVSSAAKTECIMIAASDESTALTAAADKVKFIMPYAFTLTGISASVTTAPTGATLVVDVNEAGTTLMSSDKIVIDVSETSTATAATAPALTDTALASGALITIDIDQVGSTVAGAGLKVYLVGYQT